MRTRGRAAITALFVAILAFGMVAPAAGVVTDDLQTGDHDDENLAPNPWIDVDTLTVSEHPMSEGATHDAMAGYEDDDGDWIADPVFSVNTTSDIENGDNINPYTYAPGHIEDSSREAFPDKTNRTWTNSSRWTKGGANSSGLTVEDGTPNEGLEGVRFNTGSSFASGDTAHANFSAWDGELDSDEDKRVLQVAMDVDSLETGTNVTVRVYDETDDYKEILLDEGATISGNVFANSTGDSKVFQIKLNKLTTNGGGSWDNIEKVSVIIDDGDADVVMAWLDLRKKGKDTLGEKKATTNDNGNDPDSDSEYDETQTIYNATGDISVYSMETLDAEYDDAVIHDVDFPARFEARLLQTEGEDEDYRVEWDDAGDFPGFDHVLNVTYRLELPTAIDLSYSGLELVMTQKWPEGRYTTLAYNEGMAGSNFSDVTYSDLSSNLASKGDELSLDTSISTDTEYGVKIQITLTDAERDTLEVSAGTPAGGGAGPTGGGGFDLGGLLMNPLTWIVTLAAGAVQFVRGAWPFSGG